MTVDKLSFNLFFFCIKYLPLQYNRFTPGIIVHVTNNNLRDVKTLVFYYGFCYQL